MIARMAVVMGTAAARLYGVESQIKVVARDRPRASWKRTATRAVFHQLTSRDRRRA